MLLNDIRRYRGYMPVRMEREDTLAWLGQLIGEGWLERLWLGKYCGYHEVRYRFGDVQQAQWYMKDKSWEGMPIALWLKFSSLDERALDDECWKWVRAERRRLGIAENVPRKVCIDHADDILGV